MGNDVIKMRQFNAIVYNEGYFKNEKKAKDIVKQELGNFTIIYDKNKKTDIKVIKCPYINCNDIFMEHQHYEQHLIMKHGEMPHSTLQKVSIQNQSYNSYFSKHKIAILNQAMFKQKIKTYKLMLDLYLKMNKERSIERQKEREQKRKIKNSKKIRVK